MFTYRKTHRKWDFYFTRLHDLDLTPVHHSVKRVCYFNHLATFPSKMKGWYMYLCERIDRRYGDKIVLIKNTQYRPPQPPPPHKPFWAVPVHIRPSCVSSQVPVYRSTKQTKVVDPGRLPARILPSGRLGLTSATPCLRSNKTDATWRSRLSAGRFKTFSGLCKRCVTS